MGHFFHGTFCSTFKRSPLVSDDDELPGAAGHDLLLCEAAAAPLDAHQVRVHLVRAIYSHVQLWSETRGVQWEIIDGRYM